MSYPGHSTHLLQPLDVCHFAHQTEIAWTRSELDKIELSGIRTTYAGKKAPKGRREKLTAAAIADADYLLRKERKAGEKEQVEEQGVKEITARKAAKMQSASGGNRAGVGGGSS